MPSKNIPQKELTGFLAALEKAGATRIRRSPVDVRGLIKVRWRGSLAEEEAYRAGAQAWKPVYVMSALFVALVIGLLVALAQ